MVKEAIAFFIDMVLKRGKTLVYRWSFC